MKKTICLIAFLMLTACGNEGTVNYDYLKPSNDAGSSSKNLPEHKLVVASKTSKILVGGVVGYFYTSDRTPLRFSDGIIGVCFYDLPNYRWVFDAVSIPGFTSSTLFQTKTVGTFVVIDACDVDANHIEVDWKEEIV